MPWMWTGRAKLMGVTQTNGSPKTGLFLLCLVCLKQRCTIIFFVSKNPLPLFLWPWPTLEVREAAYSSEAGSGPFLDDVPERPGTAHRKARPRVGGRNSCAATWWNEWCGCWGNSGVMSTRITKPLGCVCGDKIYKNVIECEISLYCKLPLLPGTYPFWEAFWCRGKVGDPGVLSHPGLHPQSRHWEFSQWFTVSYPRNTKTGMPIHMWCLLPVINPHYVPMPMIDYDGTYISQEYPIKSY